MNAIVDMPGIPMEFRAMLEAEEAIFSYGDCTEHFGKSFHRIPATENLWLAGDQAASRVIIGNSAMEVIAFLALNTIRYPNIKHIALIAIGSLWHAKQAEWIRANFGRRKYTLLFGNDYLGKITDIKMACAIKKKTVRIFLRNEKTEFRSGNKQCVILNDKVSLFSLERAVGWRSGIGCPKSKQYINFLEEFKNGK